MALTIERRLALLRLENTGESSLASLLERSCLFSKFQGRLHLPITASWSRTSDFWTHCTCTVDLHVLNHRWLDVVASIVLLDCSYCLHSFYLFFFVTKDTTMFGLMLQAINLQVYMRFLQVYMRFYKFIWEIDTSSWPIRLQYLLQLWSRNRFEVHVHVLSCQVDGLGIQCMYTLI